MQDGGVAVHTIKLGGCQVALEEADNGTDDTLTQGFGIVVKDAQKNHHFRFPRKEERDEWAAMLALQRTTNVVDENWKTDWDGEDNDLSPVCGFLPDPLAWLCNLDER